jgi:predicted DNA-binding transcriptional regulator YafY
MTNVPPLFFKYTNWEGKTAIRKVIPIKLWYGHTDYHKNDTWLLKATDVEKNAERDFSVNDIHQFLK